MTIGLTASLGMPSLAQSTDATGTATSTVAPPSATETTAPKTLNHFSAEGSGRDVSPLPGVQPIGFVRAEDGTTVPLLSVGGTLRQVPVGEIVIGAWRVVAVDRDSVEVNNGSETLRLTLQRWEGTVESTSSPSPATE